MVRHAVCLEFLIHPCLGLLCVVLIDGKSYTPFHISLDRKSDFERKFFHLSWNFFSLHYPMDSFCRNGREFFYLSHHSGQKFLKLPVFPLIFISKELLHFPI